jgi:Mn2+/Fe2+ NRAMP family transporter
MGLVFIAVALKMNLNFTDLIKNAFIPSIPTDSGLLIIGLVGTTVVPYNLFLASGLSRGQDIGEMRWGITLAVLIGGFISMAILLAGTKISGEFSFQALSDALSSSLGNWAAAFFGLGLFAAGTSSAITAPLAAAITGQAIYGGEKLNWTTKSRNFRMVWVIVLLTGLGFGISNVKPIPAIIAAQAINGILLPVVAVFLLLAVNDGKLIEAKYLNSKAWNWVMGFVVAIATGLGLYNIWMALN